MMMEVQIKGINL